MNIVEIILVLLIVGYSIFVIVRRVKQIKKGQLCNGSCGSCTGCPDSSKKKKH